MKRKTLAIVFVIMFVAMGMSYAADDQASPGTQAVPESIGGQAGEAARELKGTVAENYAVTSAKTAETAKKVRADAQETLKTLREQWDVLAKQLQEKTRQIQKQLDQQWQDFNKSFKKPQS
ncbi:MAG: hypothetical protein PHV97_03325 [Candidatus Omnitrophica bacterium]|nr:hypothetical protein [Candidatus Omnitrophota bacterium]